MRCISLFKNNLNIHATTAYSIHNREQQKKMTSLIKLPKVKPGTEPAHMLLVTNKLVSGILRLKLTLFN